MRFLVFLVTLIPALLATDHVKDISDIVKTHTTDLDTENEYKISQNQQLVLDYEIDQNAYSIVLEKYTSDGLQKQKTVQRKSSEGNDQANLNFELDNGCTSYKRDFFVDEIEKASGPDQEAYIIDMTILPKSQQIILVTDEYKVYRGKFDLVSKGEDKKTIQATFIDGADFSNAMREIGNTQKLDQSNIFGITSDDEQFVYLFSKYGGLKFKPSELAAFKYETILFEARKEIMDVVYHKNHVIVVSAGQGIDIYEIGQQGDFSMLLQMNSTLKGLGDYRITKVVMNAGMLVALDENHGIFFYDMSKLSDGKVTKMNMEIRSNAIRSFDIRGNTMIVVYRGDNERAVEMFLDYSKNTYFINRVYLDDIIYSDVRMDRYYAILMSDSAHRLISHSIYKKFGNTSLWDKHRYFVQLSMKFMVLLNYNIEQQTFFVQKRAYDVDYQLDSQQYSFVLGGGGNKFTIHQIEQMHTQIRCVSKKPISDKYKVTILSSDCDLDEGSTPGVGNGIYDGLNDRYSRNIVNPFIQCQRTFDLHFVTNNSLLKSEDVYVVSGFFSGIMMFIMIILIFLYILYRQAKKRRKAAQDKYDEVLYQLAPDGNVMQQPQNNQPQEQQSTGGNDEELQEQAKPQGFQIDDDN